MKKTLSIILSAIMIMSIFKTFELIAYADNFYDYNLTFGVTQCGQMTDDDCYRYETSSYKFSLEEYTTLALDFDSTLEYFGDLEFYDQMIYIIKYSDYSDWKIGKPVAYYYNNSSQTSSQCKHWLDDNFSLYKGTYCLLITTASPGNTGGARGVLEYSFSLTPTVEKVRNLKATTTSNNAKISWTRDLGADGYLLQKKCGDTYETIKTTTSTSAMIENLLSATSYNFRVCGYKTIDEVTYYGKWKYLTASTNPTKAGIKAPSTNSKHQIIVKWNKVSKASGYQIQYCKNSNCSNVVATKTISGQSKTSYTGKNFTKGKKYYVRVRAYKTVNGTKYYGAWSSVKSIKCK